MKIQCPKCGTMVSDKADACPTCGTPISANPGEVELGNSDPVTPDIDNQEQEFYKGIRNAIERNMYGEALEKTDVLLSQSDHPERYHNLRDEITEKWSRQLSQAANTYLENGERETAKEYFEKAIALRPNDPIITRKLKEINDEINGVNESTAAHNKAKLKKIAIICVVAVVLALGGYIGYSLYKQSLIVEVPNCVSSSDMIALYSVSSPDPHKIAAYSTRFVEDYGRQVEDIQSTNNSEQDSEVLSIADEVKVIIESLKDIAKNANDDDKFILTKNMNELKHLVEKAESGVAVRNEARKAELEKKSKETRRDFEMSQSEDDEDYIGGTMGALFEYMDNNKHFSIADISGDTNLRDAPKGEVCMKLDAYKQYLIFVGKLVEGWYEVYNVYSLDEGLWTTLHDSQTGTYWISASVLCESE